MRATFRGCIHLYTGRSVNQLLVLKQEPKNRAGRSMREASIVGVRLRFIMSLVSLGPSELSTFWAFRTFPVERGETQNRSPLTCSVMSKQIGKHFQRDKNGFLAPNLLSLFWLRPSDLLFLRLRLYTFCCLLADRRLMSADHLDTSAQGCSSILSFEFPRLSSLNNEIIKTQIQSEQKEVQHLQVSFSLSRL